jgi:hypothetical protein
MDRFIPLDAKTGPLRLIASAFRWHNETGEWRTRTASEARNHMLTLLIVQ